MMKNRIAKTELLMKSLKIKASADELDLALLVTEPQGPQKGIFQIAHGMCEHKERYVPFMEFLSKNGYVCVIHDHRGHGASVKSPDDLGFMYDGGWRAMVEDVRLVADWAKAHYPGLRHVLLGHSMGSMVVRSFVKRYDDMIDTLFVCGCPSDNPAKGAGKFLADCFVLFAGGHNRPKLLQKLSFGSFNAPFAREGYPVAWVCSDRQTLEEYHSDPLCMFRFTANGFSNLTALMKDCYSRRGWKVSNPGLPVHFISGADDPCLVSEAAIGKAVALMKEVGYADTDLKLYPGMRHEILNETDKARVWEDILEKIV